MFKKVILILVCLMLITAFTNVLFAASKEEKNAAEELFKLNILKGYGLDEVGNVEFMLDNYVTRAETITLIIRLLGKENDALTGTWKNSFNDVKENLWYEKYISYAYETGLSTGKSATEFGPNDNVTSNQFITFVLRALGYSEKQGDFEYNTAWKLSNELGITNGEYDDNLVHFDRGNVSTILHKAISCNKKGTSEKLFDYEPNETKDYVIFDNNYEAFSYFNINNKTYETKYLQTELNFYEYKKELYAQFNPTLYIKGTNDIRIEGPFIVLMSLCNNLYSVSENDNPFTEGNISIDLRPYKELGFNISEKKEYSSISSYNSTYCYERNNKSLSTPTENIAEIEIDSVRFVKNANDIWYVNINDFLKYFQINKKVSVEEIDNVNYITIK